MAKREEKDKRRDKKERKRKWLKSQPMDGPATGGEQGLKRARTPLADDSEGDDGDDWAELAREERMAKKVRRGDVTQRVFDEQFADL